MQSLRNTPWLAKLALLWFVLTLGVAVASPMVHSPDKLVICTSVGMVEVEIHADGSISTERSNVAQCPLCVLGSAAPLDIAPLPPELVKLLTDVQPTGVVVSHVVSTSAPPPSCGPPSAFL